MSQLPYSQTSGLSTTGTPDLSGQDLRTLTERSDELDLVDIIIFLWRWRLLIVISTLTGLTFGAVLAFYKSKVSPSLPQNGTWSLVVNTSPRSQISPASPVSGVAQVAPLLTDQISTALRSPLATLDFSPEKPDLSSQPFQKILTSWHAKLTSSSPATPPVLEFKGSTVYFRIEAPSGLDGTLLSQALIKTANQTISRYNQEVVTPFQKLEAERDIALLNLSKINFDVIRLFETKSSTPSALNVEILKSLVNNSSGPIAKSGVYFLLGGIPDSIPEKKTLLKDYLQTDEAVARDRTISEEYKKRYPPNGPNFAPTLEQATSLTFDAAAAPPITSFNPIVYLIIGGFLGGGFSMMIALVWQFARANSTRIRQGLKP